MELALQRIRGLKQKAFHMFSIFNLESSTADIDIK